MILEISIAVIAFFMVIFVIGLLIVLFQIRRLAREAEKLIDTTRQQVTPLSHDLALILHDAQKIVGSVQGQVAKVEKGVDEIQQIAVRISDFEKQVEEKIQQPFLEFAAMVAAFFKALQVLVGFRKK